MAVTDQESTLASLTGAGVANLPQAAKVQAYQAAEAYVAARCRWPETDTAGQPLPAPAPLVTAVQLLTARLLARRDTPSGVLGTGDFGVIRVSGEDRDVTSMIAPWRKLPVG